MDAINRAFKSDGVIRPIKGETIADSIAVSFPHDGDAALEAIKDSGGFGISVSDEEILCSIPELARETSVFGEPSGVVPFAALKKAIDENKVGEDEKMVVLVSGNGLKDINSAMKSVGQPLKIKPDVSELDKIVSSDFVWNKSIIKEW